MKEEDVIKFKLNAYERNQCKVEICKKCKNPFPKLIRKRSRGNGIKNPLIRSSNCLTCSPKCSRERH